MITKSTSITLGTFVYGQRRS